MKIEGIKIGRPLVLTGIKHCGKSTQGRLLAKKFNLDFYDTDDLILKNSGKSAREIFLSQGRAAFMQAEKEAVERLPKKVCVVATGGGICENEAAVKILKDYGTIIYLEVDEKTAADRIVREAVFSEDKDGKPFIANLPAYIASDNPQNESQIRSLFHEFFIARTQKYRNIANLTVAIKNDTKEANLSQICSVLMQI